MNTKSQGPHLLAPDMPVQAYSSMLESYYEQLHRQFCQQNTIPDSISSIATFCSFSERIFYAMRDLLEDDFGISKLVSDSLLTPRLGDGKILALLQEWENNAIGKREYQQRLTDGYDSPYSGYRHCWMTYRVTIFEIERLLRITRERIALDAPDKLNYRFPWINDPKLIFEVDRCS